MSNKLLVFIGGPTGVGKTQVAIALAQHFKSEIINADSRQVYKELNIGVGKPSAEQLATVPHHLIGTRSIFEPYSAGKWAHDALMILENLFKQHDIVILTGGTGLYLQSLLSGIDSMPEVSEEIATRWTTTWKEKGVEFLASTLEEKDPAYAAIVDKKNPARLIRALSVIESTGKPFSSFRQAKPVNHPFQIHSILLELPREELYKNIDQRVDEMLANGWEAEARSLLPYRHLKALQTLGYKELFDYFDDTVNWEDTVTAIKQATRRYAKRQLTWWRHHGPWHVFVPADLKGMISLIEKV